MAEVIGQRLLDRTIAGLPRTLVDPALKRAFALLRREGLKAWKQRCPVRTGYTRSQLAARHYDTRAGRRLDFVTGGRTGYYYSRLERRYGMGRFALARMRRSARRVVTQELQRGIRGIR